jgi:hypothetical protein
VRAKQSSPSKKKMESTVRCTHCEVEFDAGEAACPACGHIHEGSASCARHDFREANGICVICGDPVCEECNAASSGRMHYACPVHREVPVIEGWAQVYTTSDNIEADLIKENLASEGLTAEVLSQKDRSFTVELGDLSPVRILVPAYEYDEAQRILDAHKDSRGEVLFACPSCGEPFDGGDTSCRACGSALPMPAPGERP